MLFYVFKNLYQLDRMAGSSKTCENAYSGMYPQISPKTDIPPQRPTTLTRTSHKSYSEEPSYTSVVYNFSDEQMPYLLRVPHSPITLKQFKEYMPKKGRYRSVRFHYFALS